MDGSTRLIYVGDPMCSWCWGFAPVLEEVRERSGLAIDTVVGGLRPGPAAQPLSERLAGFLRREWASIGDRTGQEFDPGVIEELGDDWLYDSELPAMAVVEMRRRSGEVLDFFPAFSGRSTPSGSTSPTSTHIETWLSGSSTMRRVSWLPSIRPSSRRRPGRTSLELAVGG